MILRVTGAGDGANAGH